jgi:hypothetical protein
MRYDHHITATARKVNVLMETLRDITNRDEAMSVAIEMAATEAGVQHTIEAQHIIRTARLGRFEVAILMAPEMVGLTDEQFRSLRALIYG